jgi:uncharacterized phage protein (predicted DNA packaging)
VELEQVKEYLKIDGNEEDLYVSNLIEISQIYIDAMVGIYYKAYPEAVKLSTLLQQKFIHDMHKNRGTEIPNNTKADIIVASILDKLSNYEEVIVV